MAVWFSQKVSSLRLREGVCPTRRSLMSSDTIRRQDEEYEDV